MRQMQGGEIFSKNCINLNNQWVLIVNFRYFISKILKLTSFYNLESLF